MGRRLVALLLLGAALSLQAAASKLVLSPSPPRAGEPFTVTYHGHNLGCESVGHLEVLGTLGNEIWLRVEGPGCSILPPGVVNEYTASTVVGPLVAGDYQVIVFELVPNNTFLVQLAEPVRVVPVPACEATDTSLCLAGGRFEVTAEWTDFANRNGVAHAIPDSLHGLSRHGLLWFFFADNPELLVKILDGCGVNGRHWVFLSPASTVAYDVRVRDTRTGEVKVYSKPLHEVPDLTVDTQTFGCP